MKFRIKTQMFLVPLLSLFFSMEGAEITINPSTPLQKMDGVGANCYSFPFVSDLGWNWDKVKFVFDELDLKYIRMAPWFDLWEPGNDDADPSHINWKGFDPKGVIKNHDLTMIKFLKARDFDLTLGIWKTGGWLAKGSPLEIAEKDFPELGESIAAYLLWAKKLGYPIEHFEVQNEPDIASNIKYSSPEMLKKAAVQIIDQLDRYGMSEITLHLPNLSTPKNTVQWGSVMLQDEKIKNRCCAVSYHTWWVSDEEEFAKIRDFAATQKLPVWATEVGYCALQGGCFGGSHFLKPETWNTAWDYAISYWRAIHLSHASRVYHWTLLGNDAVVGKNGEKLPSFYILKHFANYIPKNAVHILSQSDEGSVLHLVFEKEKGEFTAILINKHNEYEDGILRMSNDEPLMLIEALTSAENSYMKEAIIAENEKSQVSLLLPPFSITSVKFALKK